eukprot:TRINITY_DN3794_c0_g3_i1.p1 TRINITY_DN3794_c0_g3~~TRINITY_DN3794_c0_g3_i1.p1  ORF type:complete len:208 (-),score=24.09 TRINITY_DN3794_c0_g3_i1:166-789(-)
MQRLEAQITKHSIPYGGREFLLDQLTNESFDMSSVFHTDDDKDVILEICDAFRSDPAQQTTAPVPSDLPLTTETPQPITFTCSFPTCGQTFSSAANKKRHERLHLGVRPFSCPTEGCNRSFARKYDLKIHTRTHTKEKPYICSSPGCGKHFSRSSSVREHERNVHKVFANKPSKPEEPEVPEVPPLHPTVTIKLEDIKQEIDFIDPS